MFTNIFLFEIFHSGVVTTGEVCMPSTLKLSFNKALKSTLRIGCHDCPLFNRSLKPSSNELINSS